VDRARNPLNASRLFRIAGVVASLALLAACNMVITKKPLFSAADEVGAPALRPGVWLLQADPDCHVDTAKPLGEWPDCSGGVVVAAGQITGRDTDHPSKMEVTPFTLAAGSPRIAQVLVSVDVSVHADVSASADSGGGVTGSTSTTTSSDASKGKVYAYAGARPTKSDDAGLITAFSFWPVQCGPPPPKDAKGNDVASATLHPLRGLEMKPGDTNCTTQSKDVLFAAARASEPWATSLGTAHWVRDGDH
jgi:hypothetical protein